MAGPKKTLVSTNCPFQVSCNARNSDSNLSFSLPRESKTSPSKSLPADSAQHPIVGASGAEYACPRCDLGSFVSTPGWRRAEAKLQGRAGEQGAEGKAQTGIPPSSCRSVESWYLGGVV